MTRSEATTAAAHLIGDIESSVQQRLGMIKNNSSVPSSGEITDEELLSTGEISSPEYFKPTKVLPILCSIIYIPGIPAFSFGIRGSQVGIPGLKIRIFNTFSSKLLLFCR